MGVKVCSEKEGRIQVYHVYRHCYVNGQGHWIPCGFDEQTGQRQAWYCDIREWGVEDEAAARHYSGMVNAFSWPGYLGISFMHCKNIQQTQGLPEENKAYRRWVNRGHSPIRHSHLVVSKIRNASRRLARDNNVGLHRALHFCRGHFKTYTSEAPLFGKYVGHWFWSDSVRGNPESGRVDTTYGIKRRTP